MLRFAHLAWIDHRFESYDVVTLSSVHCTALALSNVNTVTYDSDISMPVLHTDVPDIAQYHTYFWPVDVPIATLNLPRLLRS